MPARHFPGLGDNKLLNMHHLFTSLAPNKFDILQKPESKYVYEGLSSVNKEGCPKVSTKSIE